MRIVLVTPAPRGARTGNRTTALRWSRILRGLSHRVRVTEQWSGEPCELLVALHARKSFPSIERFRRALPDRRLVVALTGTDIYRDMQRDPRVVRAMQLGDRLIALQPLAEQRVPRRLRSKIRVIHQSVATPRSPPAPSRRHFDVCVIAHLRALKDPFRAALAARRLAPGSRIRVLHVGGALSRGMERRARSEEHRNPRFHWLGELPRWKALRVLARSWLLVVPSRMEGGANVVGEAVAAGVPILASRISGNTGLLGQRYPGYFQVGDTRGLAGLLRRAETDAAFLRRLRRHVLGRRPLFAPARETRAWRRLLGELQEVPTSR